MSGVSLPVSSAPYPTIADFPLAGNGVFNGGWTIYRRACDACLSLPCPKHLALIQKAFAERAATATAIAVAAEGESVVAAAESIAVSAVESLVSAA